MKIEKTATLFFFIFAFLFLSCQEVMAGCAGSGVCVNLSCSCSVDADCHGCTCESSGACAGGQLWCADYDTCGGRCQGVAYCCTDGDVPDGCTGCFSPETEIETTEGGKEIADLKPGDEVVSLDPESGEEATSLVEKVHEVNQSGYYKITTKDGQSIKVTAEHPLWTVPKEDTLTFWEYLKTESLARKVIDFLFR